MKKVSIDPIIFTAAPNYKCVVISCLLTNSGYNEALWKKLMLKTNYYVKNTWLKTLTNFPVFMKCGSFTGSLAKTPIVIGLPQKLFAGEF